MPAGEGYVCSEPLSRCRVAVCGRRTGSDSRPSMASSPAALSAGETASVERSSAELANVTERLLERLAVPGSCRQAVAELLASCSLVASGLPVCPDEGGGWPAALLYALVLLVLLLWLLAGVGFNLLSALTLAGRRLLMDTLSNRLVFGLCACDALASAVGPVNTVIFITALVPSSSQDTGSRGVVEFSCQVRLGIVALVVNVQGAFLVTIAVLRYLKVCHSTDPRPTTKNTVLVTLPGLGVSVLRWVLHRAYLTSHCARPYAVTDRGWAVLSQPFSFDADRRYISTIQIVLVLASLLVIVFCYGSIAWRSVQARWRARPPHRPHVRLAVMYRRSQSPRPSAGTRGASPTRLPVAAPHTAARVQILVEDADTIPVERMSPSDQDETRQHRSAIDAHKMTATYDIVPISRSSSVSESFPADCNSPVLETLALSHSPSRTPLSEAARGAELLLCPDQLMSTVSDISESRALRPRACPPHSPAASEHGPTERGAARRSAKVRQAPEPPALRAPALGHDVLSTVALLTHTALFALSFLLPLLMVHAQDGPSCVRSPAQHMTMTLVTSLMCGMVTTLVTPVMLVFSSDFRSEVVRRLRQLTCRPAGPR